MYRLKNRGYVRIGRLLININRKSMLLSIIIPIYKVEKFVHGTLESIYNQKFDEHEFEVICVNDGTPDNSLQIVYEFAINHENLHVINQENQGLSCARNAGLRIAKGDYIWFVDSDDKVAEGSIQQLKNIILKEPEIDFYGFDICKIQENSESKSIEQIVLRKKNKYLYDQCVNVNQLIHKVHIAPVQRFVFRKAFLDKYHLEFYPKILHEDMEFMVRAFFLAEKVMLMKYSPYYYLVRNSGSIMSEINMHSIYSKMTIIKSFQNFKRNHADGMQSKIYFNDNMYLLVLNILGSKIASPEYNDYIKKNSCLFRKIAFYGMLANFFYSDIRKVIKAFLVLISPSLYTSLRNRVF